MRPVTKKDVGDKVVIDGKEIIIKKKYSRYQDALPILETHLGQYCSYCEVFAPDSEAEHIISQDQDKSKGTDGDNFLIACGRCNGNGNKSNKTVYLCNIYLPHLHNTFYCFEYLEGGVVKLKDSLNSTESEKATALMNLVGLDKWQGNPKYPKLNKNDKQWRFRRESWENAVIFLDDFIKGEKTANEIAKFASQKGFFSIWFTVFKDHDDVKKALIERFIGTCKECFDEKNHYEPKKRTPEM